MVIMEPDLRPRGIPSIPLRAILVEDSRTIYDSLLPALDELANTQIVAWAKTLAEAEHVLNDQGDRWQLIIVDLFLAEGTGLDVLTVVRDRKPGQHAIVLSNYATDAMRRRCIEFGADAVFDKSTEIGDFIDACLVIERTE